MRKARWMRRILGIVLGGVAALSVIGALGAVIQAFYPIPEAYETVDTRELASLLDAIPLAEKLMIAASWLIGTFCGAWLALRICDWRWAGWIVAAILMLGEMANQIALPHPIWLRIAAIIAPLAGAWLARRAHHKPYKGEPLLG